MELDDRAYRGVRDANHFLEHRGLMSIKQYLTILDSSIAGHFGPDGIYNGKSGALRFAHEMGYGLADYSDDQIRKELHGTYSILVKHTFGHGTGVPLDAKPFFEEVRWSIGHARNRRERMKTEHYEEKQEFHKLAKPVGLGTDENGDYQLIPLSMVRGGKLVPRKVHTNPLRHLILDQDIKPRGWYKPKHAKRGVRPRPCSTEATLTTPYGGFCGVSCRHCYINNGTRGYRATGLPTVSPEYPDKMAKSIAQMNISGAFYISSFTEPFHHLEGQYHITQRLTEILVKEGLPLFYLSRRIPPDWAVEALLQNPYSYMQWSINTPNPDHWHKFSPGAPDLQDIFDRMAELSEAGIYISVQCNPIIAGVTTLEDLHDLIHLVKEYGGHHIIFKFVEQVANNRKIIVERMMQSKLPHVGEFDNLFSQVIGGVYTIQEDVRLQWLDELLIGTRKAGLTMGLCYEYFEDGNAGSSLAPFYTTSRGGCHGQSVPLYFRPEKGAPFEPLPGCFESGCLYCEDEGTKICAVQTFRLLEAGMLSMRDYKSIRLCGFDNNWDMPLSCPSGDRVGDFNHWYPKKKTFAEYYGWSLNEE